MGKSTYITLYLLIFLIGSVSAQFNLYTEDFNGVTPPDLPSGWSENSPQIFTNESSPSSGYSGASGGNNLLARNCNPNGDLRSFQVDGISTVGYAGLSVSFGHRRTSSFTPTVLLEWSSDGSNWNSITYSTPGTTSTWLLFTSAILPTGAEEQPNLRFKWTYTTSVANVPCDNFAGNYRIDDFKVSATTLPIELTNLTAHAQKRDILLRWETATERDNAYFAIERATDGNTFREIGQRPSLGNSRAPQTYHFTDPAAAKGTNYYRLRQVDTDGRYSYSPVVTALMDGAFVRLSPTTATDVLRLTATEPSEETRMWQIFDTGGRLLQSGSWEAESVQHELTISNLPQGHYALRLTDGQSASTVLRFQKM